MKRSEAELAAKREELAARAAGLEAASATLTRREVDTEGREGRLAEMELKQQKQNVGKGGEGGG